jgi:hypothetical protein
MRTFISGPTIAALTQTPRMTVNDHMRAAVYGPTYRIGRIVYVALENVEHVEGRKFTDAQLEAASAGLPDRVITIKEEAAV